MFIKVNNFDEYKAFVVSVEDKFDCIESWQDFFGFELKWDEETGEVLETIEEYTGDIKYSPERYPCIIYCLFDEKKYMRDKKSTVLRICDWCYEEEL